MLATFNTTAGVTYHRGGALTIPGLSLTHDGGRVLFNTTGNAVALQHGSIVGLVGTNGSGKTSLARVLASKELPNFPQDLVVEYLAASDDEEHLARKDSVVQDVDDLDAAASNLTPVEYVEQRVRQRSERLSENIADLEAKLEDRCDDELEIESMANRLSDLYELEEDLSERSQRETHHYMEELGLDKHADKPLAKLSCGWRYKCRLVSAFLSHPDLLIIDEPSFLDERSTDWFVSRAREAAEKDNAIVLLISHKEALLDALCDSVLYINSSSLTLTSYHCGHSVFRDARQEQAQHASRIVAGKEAKQDTAETSLRRLRTDLKRREKNTKKATTENADERFVKGKNKEAKQKADRSAASKLIRAKKQVRDLEETRRLARTERVKPLRMNGVPAAGHYGSIVSLREVAFAYDEEDGNVFEYVDVAIDANDRVLLTGPNGAGKSTLVRVILGEMEPTSGTVTRTGNFVYFPQTALGRLLRDFGRRTARDYLGDDVTETEARHHLGNFGLAKDLALRSINTLSAGQRVRLWLAKENLLRPKPTLLVVDEISENVDRETRDSLVELLSSFEAAVVVISHDQDFRSSFKPTKTWALARYGIRETHAE